MHIATVRIRNYRCVRDLTIPIDDYTALIGPNGTGKSTVLRALDWFFSGKNLQSEDFHGHALALSTERDTSQDAPGSDRASNPVSVEVTFRDLTEHDRRELGVYAIGQTARLARSAHQPGPGKLVGFARQGPGFGRLRAPQPVNERRAEFAALLESVDGLRAIADAVRPPGTRGAWPDDKITAVLSRWEDDPKNEAQLEQPAELDASHLKGFDGTNALRRRIRFVMVPAGTDLASDLAGVSAGSAVRELLGAVVRASAEQAHSEWLTEHRDAFEAYDAAVGKSIRSTVKHHQDRVNDRLGQLVRDATVSFEPDVPEPKFSASPGISTSVSLDNGARKVEHQGHGVQRAVVMAILQALATDSKEDAQPEASPSLVIAIEEPEIYQHPVRARHFARALSSLTETSRTQMLLATHSPYFVLPQQFASLRRFSLDGAASQFHSASEETVARAAATEPEKVKKRLELQLPRTFSEGFFSDATVLVEGETDRVIINAMADLLGRPLDAAGISVISVEGKNNLRLARALLQALGTPTYVVVDGDHDPSHSVERQRGHGVEMNTLLDWLPRAKPLHGACPTEFGSAT
ncbi:MAG: AAA family ATPase, partial [Patulibacter sp.]